MLLLLFSYVNDRNQIFLKFPDFKDISVGQIRPLASAVSVPQRMNCGFSRFGGSHWAIMAVGAKPSGGRTVPTARIRGEAFTPTEPGWHTTPTYTFSHTKHTLAKLLKTVCARSGATLGGENSQVALYGSGGSWKKAVKYKEIRQSKWEPEKDSSISFPNHSQKCFHEKTTHYQAIIDYFFPFTKGDTRAPVSISSAFHKS